MTTIQLPTPTAALLVERLRAVPRASLRSLAAVLVSLVAPGVGTALRGQVGRGLTITAGFVAFALLPTPALGVVGMACFWVFGMVTVLPLPGED